MSRKLTAISLFVLLLASQFGHHVLYSIQDWMIRESQEKMILDKVPDNLLVRFEDGPDLSWEEAGKEFEHGGQMYDVVRSHQEQGKLVYYAVRDGEEGKLINSFSKILKIDPNAPPSSKGKLTLKIQLTLFTVPELLPELIWPTPPATQVEFASVKKLNRPHAVLPCPPWA